jgi:hypothetical protein
MPQTAGLVADDERSAALRLPVLLSFLNLIL